ncbi:MAG: universal stress protein [Vicinamibacterales bacterium]
MIALKSVLVPTDFSETSEAALRYGKAFATAFGAALHVVHVIEEPCWRRGGKAYGFSLSALQDEWVKEAETRMAGILSEDERTALKAVTRTLLGHPVMEIMRYATEHRVDLIVMGTHGRVGRSDTWSWAASPNASCARRRAPVLTLHADQRAVDAEGPGSAPRRAMTATTRPGMRLDIWLDVAPAQDQPEAQRACRLGKVGQRHDRQAQSRDSRG